jgi:phosphatidylserine/phosphatidylglycerophosphate/cardiolipin synthase-like enzyme
MGSANWTRTAETLNVEAAVAVADRSFVKAATRHVAGIISGSESMTRYSATPPPTWHPANSTWRRSPTMRPSFIPATDDDLICKPRSSQPLSKTKM